MKRTVLALCLAAAAFAASAADLHHTIVPADGLKWGPAPPSLPPGAQASILYGHPAKEGPFVIRLKFPSGFVIPPHTHTKDELVTVMSGRMGITGGEKVDPATTPSLQPGSFIHLPGGMAHYAVAHEESIVQINGVGPFDVTYLDPRDDPRKKVAQSAR